MPHLTFQNLLNNELLVVRDRLPLLVLPTAPRKAPKLLILREFDYLNLLPVSGYHPVDSPVNNSRNPPFLHQYIVEP